MQHSLPLLDNVPDAAIKKPSFLQRAAQTPPKQAVAECHFEGVRRLADD